MAIWILPGRVYGRSPLAGPFLPDGRKSSGRAYGVEPFSVFAPIAFTNGNRKNNTYSVRAQVYVTVDILKGLQWDTKAAYNMDYFFRKAHSYSTPGEFYFYQPVNGEYVVDQAVGNPAYTRCDRLYQLFNNAHYLFNFEIQNLNRTA